MSSKTDHHHFWTPWSWSLGDLLVLSLVKPPPSSANYDLEVQGWRGHSSVKLKTFEHYIFTFSYESYEKPTRSTCKTSFSNLVRVSHSRPSNQSWARCIDVFWQGRGLLFLGKRKGEGERAQSSGLSSLTGISHFPGSLPGLFLLSNNQVSVDNRKVFVFPLNLSLLQTPNSSEIIKVIQYFPPSKCWWRLSFKLQCCHCNNQADWRHADAVL